MYAYWAWVAFVLAATALNLCYWLRTGTERARMRLAIDRISAELAAGARLPAAAQLTAEQQETLARLEADL